MRKTNVVAPVYYRIALDIAARIADGQYSVGQKVYARSSLAGHYGVSAESARRAVAVLSDLEIVEAEKGSGVRVTSVENAKKFITSSQDINTLHSLKNDIFSEISRQQQSLESLHSQLKTLFDTTERFKNTNPFVPFRITINGDMTHLNKTAAEVRFWQHTTATIIAVKRNGELILSPGPYVRFEENDILYFIGDECAYEKVMRYCFGPEVLHAVD